MASPENPDCQPPSGNLERTPVRPRLQSEGGEEGSWTRGGALKCYLLDRRGRVTDCCLGLCCGPCVTLALAFVPLVQLRSEQDLGVHTQSRWCKSTGGVCPLLPPPCSPARPLQGPLPSSPQEVAGGGLGGSAGEIPLPWFSNIRQATSRCSPQGALGLHSVQCRCETSLREAPERGLSLGVSRSGPGTPAVLGDSQNPGLSPLPLRPVCPARWSCSLHEPVPLGSGANLSVTG